jgi:hypothetical protein
VPGIRNRLREDERAGGNDPRLRRHRPEHGFPIVHSHSGAAAHHADVGGADQNLLAKVPLKPIHDTHHDDECAHADHDATDRDDADEREDLRPAAAAQVSPRDVEFEGHLSHHEWNVDDVSSG